MEEKRNPLFEADEIGKKGILSDERRLNKQGKKIGSLEPGGFWEEKETQIIRDKRGKKIGKIEKGGLLDPPDTQKIIINGKEVARIETSFWGERIIKTKNGEKGVIRKNIWGETKIDWKLSETQKEFAEILEKLKSKRMGT